MKTEITTTDIPTKANTLSTAQLRKLEQTFSKPDSLAESLILSGVRAELKALHQDALEIRGFPKDWDEVSFAEEDDDLDPDSLESRVIDAIM